MKIKAHESGQALILIVFGIVALIGLTGLAVDGGNAYSDRRNAQNAADTAALAAALAKINNPNSPTIVSTTACDRSASNGFPCSGGSGTVTVNNPPTAGCGGATNPYSGNSEYIQVIINTNVSTYFAPVVGVRQLHNCVEAISRAQPGVKQMLYNGNAVVGLKRSGCNAVYLAGNEQLQTWGGGVFSNSADTCGLTFQGSSNTQTHGPGGYSMAANGYTTIGNPAVDDHGNGFNFNQSQYVYPPEDLPNPVCNGNASISGANMSAGSYTGTFPPNNVTHLNPGVYCIYGDFVMNGNSTLNGNSVLIVLENGAIQWNGDAQINLTAITDPASPLAGLLIYAPMSNTNTMQINGNSNSTLIGTILTPAANIVINGNNSQLQKVDSQLVGYTVTLSGSSDTQITMITSHQYQPVSAPHVQLRK